MQRRSFFGGVFGGVVAWLFGTRTAAASPPYVTILTGTATLFVSRVHSVGEHSGHTVTEGCTEIPVGLIQYGDGKIVVNWDVTKKIHHDLDPGFRAFDPQSGVPKACLVITPQKGGLTRTATGETSVLPVGGDTPRP